MQFGDIEPLLLPLLDGVVEGTFRPNGLGNIAYHGTAALGVFSTHHHGLHIANLQPQVEVRQNPEKGLAHDDERRDIEKRVGGKIMKINPIVIHDSTYKWVEGKPEPTDKMGKEGTRLSREAPE